MNERSWIHTSQKAHIARFHAPVEDRKCQPLKAEPAACTWALSSPKTGHQAIDFCDSLRRLSCESGTDVSLFHSSVLPCVNVMRSFSADGCVQNSALLALAALCEKRQLSSMIGEHGGVHQLLDAWGRFANDVTLVKNCVITMRSLSETEHNREVFCGNNGIEMLRETLRSYPHRASIQIAGAVLIANLCFENEERRKRIIQGNVPELLLKALKEFDTPSHFRLQTNVCLALRNVSMDKSGCDAIFKHDCNLETLIRVIDMSHYSSVARESLGVLLNLATQEDNSEPSPHCVERIMTSLLSFLDRTAQYISRYGECHEICFAAIRPFLNRANDSCHILSVGSRQNFFRIALMYAKDYMSSKSPLAQIIVTSVCAGVRIMLINSQNRQSFSTLPDGASILVDCISFLSGRPLHVEHALVALGNAVFDSPRGKEEVRQSDGIEIVLSVMKQNYYTASVAEASLLALHGICSSDERNGETATAAMAHMACARTMECFRDNPVIQERGLAAMLSFGNTADAVAQLKNVSAVEIAEGASTAFPFSKAIAAQETKIRSLLKDDDTLVHSSGSRLQRRKKSFSSHLFRPFSRG